MLARTQLALKRAADVAAAGVLLAACAPLLGALALLVRATSPGPAIFRQRRIGLGGRPFEILKLRTMVQDAPLWPDEDLSDEEDPRVTRLGRFLRRTSLDELPQLVNVLRGDMSFVGPRPDLPEHVERYTPRQLGRLAVRPGLTGWAQVNGRNHITWPARIELDLDYLDGWWLGRDVEVVVRTIRVVLSGKGSSQPGAGRPGAATDQTGVGPGRQAG